MPQYLVSVYDQPDSRTRSAAGDGADHRRRHGRQRQGEGRRDLRLRRRPARPGATATVIDARGGTPQVSDGPYLETKEYLGGILGDRGARSGRRAGVLAQRGRGLPAAARGAPVHGGAARSLAPRAEVGSADDRGRSTAGNGPCWWPRWHAASALTSPRRRPARRSSRLLSTGGEQPPPNPGGWLMTTATRKAIDRVRRDSRRRAEVLGGDGRLGNAAGSRTDGRDGARGHRAGGR